MAKCFLACITLLVVILLLINYIHIDEAEEDGAGFLLIIILPLLVFEWIITIRFDKNKE
jgi:hypothetical protein